jgi:AcrR family transcriptional regulator
MTGIAKASARPGAAARSAAPGVNAPIAKRRERKSLQRELIVTTALELAEREGPGALTMRRLGEELAIDPTALYRLFGDKDELLLAIWDKITTISFEALGDPDPTEEWQAVLRRIAEQTWRATSRFPAVVALMAARTSGGATERKMVELILSTFVAAGLPPAEAVRYYRSFADALLALCGQTAALAVLEPEIREKDATAWSRIYARLPQEEYPAARAHIAELTTVSERSIFDTVVNAIIASAAARAAELEG